VWGAPNAGDCIPVKVACAAPHFVMLPKLDFAHFEKTPIDINDLAFAERYPQAIDFK
jgi:hypothetical protein